MLSFTLVYKFIFTWIFKDIWVYFFEWIYDFGLSEEYEIECKSE